MFPEKYPFDYADLKEGDQYWFKYYISQRTFFAFKKQATYQNFELLTNAFATKVINFEQAEIYQLKTNELDNPNLKTLLKTQNLYCPWRFTERAYMMMKLKDLEADIYDGIEKAEREKSKF